MADSKTKNTKRYRIVGTQLLRNKKMYPPGTVLDDLSDEEAEQLGDIVELVGPEAVHETPSDYHHKFKRAPDGSMIRE